MAFIALPGVVKATPVDVVVMWAVVFDDVAVDV